MEALVAAEVPYEIVEVHPLNKAEVKDFSPDYKKVPIVRIDTSDQGVLY